MEISTSSREGKRKPNIECGGGIEGVELISRILIR